MEWQLLRDLTEAERRQVLATATRRQFKRGEILFHEGDPADTVHFIAEGRVMARRTSPMGDSVAFRVIGPGSCARRRRGRVVGPPPQLDGHRPRAHDHAQPAFTEFAGSATPTPGSARCSPPCSRRG